MALNGPIIVAAYEVSVKRETPSVLQILTR